MAANGGAVTIAFGPAGAESASVIAMYGGPTCRCRPIACSNRQSGTPSRVKTTLPNSDCLSVPIHVGSAFGALGVSPSDYRENVGDYPESQPLSQSVVGVDWRIGYRHFLHRPSAVDKYSTTGATCPSASGAPRAIIPRTIVFQSSLLKRWLVTTSIE